MKIRQFLIVMLTVGVFSVVSASTAAAHSSSSEGLSVTESYIQTSFDKVPRLCNTPHGVISHKSAQSGRWSDPATWGGSVPSTNARVQISGGTNVLYDMSDEQRISCIEIQNNGGLTFANQATKLILDDGIWVLPHASLTIGTKETPITSLVEITFADTALKTGTIDVPGPDPQQYGKGLLVWGDLTLHGQEKTSHVQFAQEPVQGDTVLKLKSPPGGWEAGDIILIPDTRQIKFTKNNTFTSQAEEVQVQSIQGSEVTITSPLQFNHRGPRDGAGQVTSTELQLLPHAINLNRSIVFSSENVIDPLRRGYALNMHRAQVNIAFAAFNSMGRTVVGELDNTEFDSAGKPTKIGTNQIGRYSIHNHHLWGPRNPDNAGYQVEVVGTVMNNFLKWALTIHDSHYGLYQNNVVYDGQGSAIVTEDGNEAYNVFDANVVIHTKANTIEEILERHNRAGIIGVRRAFGIERDGFWFSGPHNYVRNNIVANAPGFAYNYNGYYLPDQFTMPLVRGADMKKSEETEVKVAPPVLESKNNTAYGATGQGLWLSWSRGCCSVARWEGESHFESYKIWHTNHRGAEEFHETNNRHTNFIIRGDEEVSGRNEIWRDSATGRYNVGFTIQNKSYENGDFTLENSDIQGYNIGLFLSPNPQNGRDEVGFLRVTDVRLNNYLNIVQPNVVTKRITVLKNISFEAGDAKVPGFPDKPYNIHLNDYVGDFVSYRPMRLSQLFLDNNQIFSQEQAPNAIVWPAAREAFDEDITRTCPEQGFTNKRCQEEFGVSNFGEVAPCEEEDGDITCAAAKQRGEALKTNGLVFEVQGASIFTDSNTYTFTVGEKGQFHVVASSTAGRIVDFFAQNLSDFPGATFE